MKILNFGSCNIDYVYSVDHFVKAGETLSAGSMEIFPGGKGLNQSIALARAGARVYHAGYLGNDSTILEKAMKESGVDISLVDKKNTPNGHAIIQVDKSGENCIIVHGGTNTCISREYIDNVLANFTKDDMLLLQNEINDIPYIIDKACELGIKTVFNPAPFTDSLKGIDMNKIFCIILNETEAEALCGSDTPDGFVEYLKEYYPHLKAVLTLGSKGCIYIDSDTVAEHSAYRVNVVDTTAAGDTFTGYFVAQIAEGKPYREAIKIASAASAIAVSRPGAAPSIPFKNEVVNLMGQMQLSDERTENKNKQLKKKIMNYIDDNITGACLDGLAEKLGYSRSYAGIVVKDITGMSFSSLVMKRRCEKAASELRETDIPIGEIITRAGYENESFFRKKFMEIYGKSPLKYRKGE